MRVLAYKFSSMRVEMKAQHIVKDQHLAIAMRTSADTDSRHRNSLGNGFSQDVWHSFEDKGEDARRSQRTSIFQQFTRRIHLPALDAIAPHRAHGLGSQAQMPHHRYFCRQNGLNHGKALTPPLQLHCVSPPFTDQAASVAHCL